jgi:hypothetical protein
MVNPFKEGTDKKDDHWDLLESFVRIGSRWVTLIGERWRCDKGKTLEYWRVEKPDSVIVLPLQEEHILCPTRSFRPGVGRATLDFPGGRLPTGMVPAEVVPDLLERELGVSPEAIVETEQINAMPLLVNSSFSNQRLWGYAAMIDEAYPVPESRMHRKFPTDETGLASLLERMECLQCRALLLDWARKHSKGLLE